MTTPLPSVPDFLAGYGPQQSDWQSLWVNAAAFFQQRVVFRATQATTPTTLPSSGAVTVIAYDNIIEDPYSGWNATLHQWFAPAGYSGWYQVTVTVWVVAPTAQQAVLQPYITGGAASDLASGIALNATVIPEAAAGSEGTYYPYLVGGQDSISGAGSIQNYASNLNTNLAAGESSSIEIVWISA